MISFAHNSFETIFSNLISRKRERDPHFTDHDDPFISKALKHQDKPSSFYDLSHSMSQNCFETRRQGVSIRKDILCDYIAFCPSFYYPRQTNEDSGLVERTNPLTIIKRIGGDSSVALILLNPWGVSSNVRTDYHLGVKLARKYGIDVVLSTVPLHKKRAPDSYESGELALNGNSGACLRSFKQGVEESVVIRDYLKKKHHYKYVGIGGISLGGIIASVAASISKYSFCVQLYASGYLSDIIWSSSRLRFLRDHFISGAVNKDTLTKHWRVIDPVSFVDSAKTRKIQVIVGKTDKVIPYSVSKRYIELLQVSDKLSIDVVMNKYSHYSGILLLRLLHNNIGKFINNSCK